jgi:hypothetical protein
MVPAEGFPDAAVNKAGCEAMKDLVLQEFDKAVSESRRV